MFRIEETNIGGDMTARFQQQVDDVSRALGIMQTALKNLKSELYNLDRERNRPAVGVRGDS